MKYFDEISEEQGKQNLKDIFSSEPEIRVRFPENTTNFIQRTLDNFANFLSLISLAALIAASVSRTRSLPISIKIIMRLPYKNH